MRRAGRRSREPRLGAAVTEYLATLDHPESAATEYGYAILDRFLHADRSGTKEPPTGADGLAAAVEMMKKL